MDRIESMKVYMRVSELGSFVKAADSLGMSKASVSNVVQQLEADLGTRLLHRTTRKVQMTQDGITFYQRCKDLVADVEEVESLFKKDASHIVGRIRIDMPNRMARSVVIPNLPAFLKKYPGIEVELSSTDRKVDLVSEGFDCVLRVGALGDSGYIARHLGELAIVNCASPQYIKQYGKPKRLEDLEKHFLVHYTPVLGAKPDGFEYFDGEKYQSLPMKGRVSVNNSETYTEACLAGLGIVQIPYVGARPYLDSKALVEVLPEYHAEPMPVSLIYPHRRHISKRVQIFMEWMQTLIKDYID